MNSLLGYAYNPPAVIKKVFKDFQWDSVEKKILLTFDDGPNPNTTNNILDVLNKYSIKSVFFCVGENLLKYPDLANGILNEGHLIGNHTMRHQRLTGLNELEIQGSIQQVQEVAIKNLNLKIRYFRPPHGRFALKTAKILKENDLQNVMWSLLTYDYKNDLNIVKFAVSNYLNADSIIVLHDSDKSSEIIKDSIDFIIEHAAQRKYKIGKPSECLRFYSQ